MQTILFSVLIVLGVLLLFAAALLIFRAFLYGRMPEKVEPEEGLAVEGALVAEHLATAVRIQTVSTGEKERMDYRPFTKLHAALEKMYPRVHATLQREVINQYSLLFTWPGRAEDLDPVLLYGHLDVVPADPATLSEWTHPPFSGVVADGCVWGRGTLDMKGTVVTLLEAAEGMIKTGYQPERTVYLAFGHDEEVGGLEGARAIAGVLETRGVRLAALCDEGGSIMQEMVPGVKIPTAVIGIAEKGYATLELKVEGRPGHSSMPPPHTAVGVLARAVARIESNPMPARLSMVKLMLDEVGIFLPFTQRLALANPWLFGGVLRKRLEASATTNAQIRTTAAATIIQGGLKDNMLPAKANALVNCRLLPGDTRETVLAHYRKVIDDEAVQVSLFEEGSWEATPVTSVDSPVYAALTRTVQQIFPDVLVAPFLMVGATDSRHFLSMTSNIFRFSPNQLNSELLRTVHGIDERVSIDTLEKMVKFYAQLIKSWTTVVGTGE